MNVGVQGDILRCSEYVTIDVRGRAAREVEAVYREFAAMCIRQEIRRAVVLAGDEDRSLHYGLRDAFTTIILAAGIPGDFRLALVPETPGVEAVYRLIMRDFQVLGINVQIFKACDAALAWIDGAVAIAPNARGPIQSSSLENPHPGA